ncbi:MAG TPA: IS200/IS605 family transposase [Bacteroidia bacterium]|jgi:REP element-mobilizing transposase RayT
MANTYTQIYIQIVFAVKGRQSLVLSTFKEEVQKFITGIIEKRDSKLIAIYCMPDHTHILIRMKPTTLLSDLVRDVKAGSSKFINDNNWLNNRFEWQNGFGAFSYNHSQVENVRAYINNQEAHHQKIKFKEEFIDHLQQFGVNYHPDYLFE